MAEVKVLDGGFSTQLSKYVGEKIDGDPLWTARFLVTDPGSVFATHLDFLRAGADIIQTNTYQATLNGFAKYLNFSDEESIGLLHKAVEFSKKAVEIYKKETKNLIVANSEPLISGSCGPYGASLHDGSEYTGTYNNLVSANFIKEWHKPRIKALLDSGVDMLSLETIPCRIEAFAIVELLREFPNAKAWLSLSCRNDGKSIAEGSSFHKIAVECYKRAAPGQILAVGMNCIAPQFVTPLIKGINQKNKEFIPLVVYPNSGEVYTVAEGWQKKEEYYPIEQFIPEWLNQGVRIVGGCCRTNATDVEKIRAAVEKYRNENF
ncbi:homocysteine S-methyltransferase-like [Prorops nasuta]|uniref:homocysteine S-methyltransferase-like n=1 Tax=Prorops nasuta TaxID=863751 RepID=UPI0034D00136